MSPLSLVVLCALLTAAAGAKLSPFHPARPLSHCRSFDPYAACAPEIDDCGGHGTPDCLPDQRCCQGTCNKQCEDVLPECRTDQPGVCPTIFPPEPPQCGVPGIYCARGQGCCDGPCGPVCEVRLP